LLSGAFAPETPSEAFIASCGEPPDENGQNLIKVMSANNRLKMLPDVLEQFIHLRAVSQAIAEVEVISADQLSDEHLASNVSAMAKRLSR
ncbi:ATP synthase F1 subunit delta, partial [Klebsiella pneumoniae]|uniref:ATP synthase F1 subunit delta n=1 Tax=Klebsiella pneumoniae TaxID=573 RepID=UPI002246F8EE